LGAAEFRVIPTEKSAMTEPEDIVEALGIDRVLVLRFLVVFSRFEYSMKRSGFVKGHDPVEPDWDTYANGLRSKFQSVNDPGFSAAVKILVDAPPRKQILSGSSLDWKTTIVGAGEQHESYVLRLVRIVRNNLFHGGKYPVPVGPLEDVGRNSLLLQASLTVLKQCLQLSPELRTAFEETT